MRSKNLVGLVIVVLTVPSAALAQRVQENAIASAEDAFGQTVGSSSIGIYGETDVRGFSPTDAGNLRIEGLYFDQQGLITGRLQQSSTIRVGISAQSYAFPAPTGIADFALRKPGADAVASVFLTYGPRGEKLAELDTKLPIVGDRLGIVAGAAIGRFRRPFGGTPNSVETGLLMRFAPAETAEILAFSGFFRSYDNEAQPLIFTGGSYLPKRFRRGRFLGQPWNDFSATSWTHGLIGRADLAGFRLSLGAFRSDYDNDVSTADLLLGAGRAGEVRQRIIVRERDDRYTSTSGELRVSRAFSEGPRHHLLIASLRARDVKRRYGGAALVDLGPSRYDAVDLRPEPATVDGPKTLDFVKQKTLGFAYQGRWRNLVEVGASLQRTDYRKRVVDPDPAVALPVTRAAPWLPAATAAIHLSPKLALYGGFTKGLEESAVAPIEAVNRNDAPPAIRTEQIDAGLRLALSPAVTAVAGLFRISKPYFNLDPQQRFRELGTVTNRGVELSLAGQVAPGLNVVVGTVLLDAKLAGEEVDAGSIGKRPIGSFVRRTLASVDYRPAWLDRLSIDAVLDSSSRRVANLQNSLFLPARATLSIGGRYRMKVGGTPLVVRAQVRNLTNRFGWNVGRSGFFTPIEARGYLLSLAADF